MLDTSSDISYHPPLLLSVFFFFLWEDDVESPKPAAKVPAKAGGGRRGLNLSAFKQARGFI